MKERRGPLGRTVGAVAQGIAGAARRRALERAPRALVYDDDGNPTLVAPGSPEQDRLVDAAARLVALADPRGADGGEDPPDEDEQAPAAG